MDCRAIKFEMSARMLALLVLGLMLQGGPGFAQSPLALTHVRIIDGHGGIPIEEGTLLIEGKRIVAVGAGVRIPSDAQVEDLRGTTVMPGLVDMHVHLVGGWDGYGVDLLGYRRYMNALLYAGVTTVLDTGNVASYVMQLRAEVANGTLLGPPIYCVGPLVDGADPIWPDISVAVSSADQVPSIVGRLKRDNVDFVKLYVGLSDPLIGAISREAMKLGLRTIVDQSARNGSPDLMRQGIAGFAHAPTTVMSDSTIQLAKEKTIFFISTLAVYESFARSRFQDLTFLDDSLIADTMPPAFLKSFREYATRPLTPPEQASVDWAKQSLSNAKVNIKKIVDAGLLLAAGTDGQYPGDFQGEGIHRELELLVEAGLSPLQAISAATNKAAIVLNAAEEWGTLDHGKLANVLVIAGKPDLTISDTRKIRLVIKEGKVLDRNKLKLTLENDPRFLPISP